MTDVCSEKQAPCRIFARGFKFIFTGGLELWDTGFAIAMPAISRAAFLVEDKLVIRITPNNPSCVDGRCGDDISASPLAKELAARPSVCVEMFALRIEYLAHVVGLSAGGTLVGRVV